jgi:hypothetical protein
MLRRIPPLIMILLLFAAIGFGRQLLADPVNTLLVIGLSALLFYLVSNYLKSGRFFPGTMKKNPLKQRFSAQRSPAKKQANQARKPNPFQVIQGSKSKSKQKEEQRDPKNNIFH